MWHEIGQDSPWLVVVQLYVPPLLSNCVDCLEMYLTIYPYH